MCDGAASCLVNMRGEDAGSQAVGFSSLSPVAQFSKADSEERHNAEGMGVAGKVTVTAGWLFCGCLAGDLLEEWIQK